MRIRPVRKSWRTRLLGCTPRACRRATFRTPYSRPTALRSRQPPSVPSLTRSDRWLRVAGQPGYHSQMDRPSGKLGAHPQSTGAPICRSAPTVIPCEQPFTQTTGSPSKIVLKREDHLPRSHCNAIEVRPSTVVAEEPNYLTDSIVMIISIIVTTSVA